MALPQAHLPRSPPPMYPPPPGYEHSIPLGPPGLDDRRLHVPQVPQVPQDMLSQISQRVRHATGHAELQVVAELRRMESSMAALADKVRRVETLLSQLDKARGSQAATQEGLEKTIAGMEQKKEQEFQAIKRDLHHTIIVHNHNADLMADHKAAIDTIYAAIEDPQQDKPTPAQVHMKQMYEHLAQISATLEESGQKDIDDLLERGEVILQRATKALAALAPMYHHSPSMPPGPGLPGHAHAMPYAPPEAYLGAPDMMTHMSPYPPHAPHYFSPHAHYAPPVQYPPHHLMMR